MKNKAQLPQLFTYPMSEKGFKQVSDSPSSLPGKTQMAN